jgi:ATP-dependent RNA helicase DeaD
MLRPTWTYGRKDFLFMPSFYDFSLQPTTRAVLATMEITEPTPIQIEAIPALLVGRDLVGQSATGSGKTLAYAIPIIERLSKNQRLPQALILVPTRELAVQVNNVISKFASSKRLTTALLVGGRPYASQISALRYGAQIIVGTPGRIKDHLERGSLVLNQLRMCILDEADQMLDIGFAPIIEDILSTTPDTRQMALFSATMPDWISKLQQKYLKDPVKIEIAPATGADIMIEQIAYQVPHDQKMAALCTLLKSTDGESSLIFGKTKYGVEKLGKQLTRLGFMVGTLHGDKSQRAREDTLMAFRRGHVQTLLATNVAARGLDIKGITQVINYELPESSELFTHRIGRTGRMGHQGKAITLLVPSDVPKWRRMARSLGQQTVLLQKLVIDQSAMLSVATSDTLAEAEYEKSSEQRPAFAPRRFNPDQGRSTGARPVYDDGYRTPTRKQKERITRNTPAWQEELPERPYPGNQRDDQRDAEPEFSRSRDDRRPQNASGRTRNERRDFEPEFSRNQDERRPQDFSRIRDDRHDVEGRPEFPRNRDDRRPQDFSRTRDDRRDVEGRPASPRNRDERRPQDFSRTRDDRRDVEGQPEFSRNRDDRRQPAISRTRDGRRDVEGQPEFSQSQDENRSDEKQAGFTKVRSGRKASSSIVTEPQVGSGRGKSRSTSTAPRRPVALRRTAARS